MVKIKTFVINLDRRSDRLIKFQKEMDRHSIKYERFSAIDGSRLNLSVKNEYNDKICNMFTDNTFSWRRSIVGVALSHITLWRNLINSDDDYFMIFEDDITLDEKFNIYYNSLLEEIQDTKYPFIFIGYHTDKEFLKKPFFLKEVENKTLVYELKYKKHIWGGLFSYIIHKDFAKQLLDDIESNGIKDPVDTFVLRYNNLYATLPVFVHSDYMTFTNMIDSDIQYDHATVFDDYDFYQLVDSPGNDIRWVNAKTFKELMDCATNDKTCVAFNTYGFLKSKLCDPANFVELPGANSKAHGLYIKRNIDNNVSENPFKNEPTIYEGYDFYQLSDSVGDDLRWVNAATLDELRDIANSDPECVAFNTYGYLKKSISDPKDFIELSSAKTLPNYLAHGLYVKKIEF